MGKGKERERRIKREREESIRERPNEIMYTSKMMATVHAMGRQAQAEGGGGVSLSGADSGGERSRIYRVGRSDLAIFARSLATARPRERERRRSAVRSFRRYRRVVISPNFRFLRAGTRD